MTSFWSRHQWFRRTIYTFVIGLAVCIVILLSIAYGYVPPEDRTHTPAYLRWMQAQQRARVNDIRRPHLDVMCRNTAWPDTLITHRSNDRCIFALFEVCSLLRCLC